MPKMKTNRMTAKKFRVGGTGTVKRKQAFKSHNTGKKSPKRIRQLRGALVVDESNQKSVTKMLPYLKKAR